MSIHAVADTTRATTDAQVIAGMAAAVLAAVARIHADALADVQAIAENPVPVRAELPPVAEHPAEETPVLEDHVVEDDVVEDQAVLDHDVVEDDEPAAFEDDEPVVRIAEPLWAPPQPRGRHLSEALTDQLPAQSAA